MPIDHPDIGSEPQQAGSRQPESILSFYQAADGEVGEVFPAGRGQGSIHEKDRILEEWDDLASLLADTHHLGHRTIRLRDEADLLALINAIRAIGTARPEALRGIRKLRIRAPHRLAPSIREHLLQELDRPRATLTELLLHDPQTEVRRSACREAGNNLPAETWQVHPTPAPRLQLQRRLRSQLREKAEALSRDPSLKITLALSDGDIESGISVENFYSLVGLLVRHPGRVSLEPSSVGAVLTFIDTYFGECFDHAPPDPFLSPAEEADLSLRFLVQERELQAIPPDPRNPTGKTVLRFRRGATLSPDRCRRLLRILVEQAERIVLDVPSRERLLDAITPPKPAAHGEAEAELKENPVAAPSLNSAIAEQRRAMLRLLSFLGFR